MTEYKVGEGRMIPVNQAVLDIENGMEVVKNDTCNFDINVQEGGSDEWGYSLNRAKESVEDTQASGEKFGIIIQVCKGIAQNLLIQLVEDEVRRERRRLSCSLRTSLRPVRIFTTVAA